MVMSLGLLYLVLVWCCVVILLFEFVKMVVEGSLSYLNVYDVVYEYCGENIVEFFLLDEIFLFEYLKRIFML